MGEESMQKMVWITESMQKDPEIEVSSVRGETFG